MFALRFSMVSTLSDVPFVVGKDLEEPSQADGSPDVVVLAEGGEICAYPDLNGCPQPSLAIAYDLCVRAQALLGDHTPTMNVIPSAPQLVLSDQASLSRIEQFGQRLQEVLREEPTSDVVVLAGSHKIHRYATAVILAVSPEDLGRFRETGEHIQNHTHAMRSLIIACTRYAGHVDGSQALETVRDALVLAQHPYMRGRAGVLFGENVYPLPGLRRPPDSASLASQYGMIGEKEEEGDYWFIADEASEHVPIGDGSPFQIEHRVKTYVLGGESGQAPDAMIGALWSDAKANTSEALRGAVIKNADSRHPFSISDADDLATLDRTGIPIVVVGEHNGEGTHSTPVGSHYEHLIDGSDLYSGEAKLLLAYWLKGAESVGYESVADIVAYVRQKLDAYPFR